MKRSIRGLAVAVAATMILTVGAFAAVSFDPVSGAGFVGKGDVQLVFGMNNKQLQANADDVQFRASSQTVVETTWTCTRDAGTQTQERERTTTTTYEGVLDSVARERNQITGFNLLGYDGAPTTDTDHDGPAIGSCPTNWSMTDGPTTGDPEELGGGLQVSIDGITWFDL